MGKRGADVQLTKDDVADDDDVNQNDASTSAPVRASEQVMAQRRVIQLGRDATGKVDLTKKAKVVNPFANIDLRVKNTNSAPAASFDFGAIPATAATPATAAASNNTVTADALKAQENTTETSAAASKEEKKTTSGAAEAVPAADIKNGAKNDSTTTNADASVTKPASSSTFGGFGSGTAFKGFGEAAAPASSGFGSAAAGSGFSFASSFPTTTSSLFGQAAVGSSSNATIPFTFGSTKPFDANAAAANNADNDEDETTSAGRNIAPIADLPTDYHCSTGEEDETVLLSMRCHVRRWVPAAAANETNDGANDGAPSVNNVKAVAPSEQFAIATDNKTAAAAAGNEGDAKSSDENKNHSLSAAATTANGAWKEVGTGPLKLLQQTNDATMLRVVQRRESFIHGPPTRVALNLPLYAQTRVELVSDKYVKVISPLPVYLPTNSDSSEGSSDATAAASFSFLFKFKDLKEASEFHVKLVAECTANARPAAKSGSSSK
ncbi:hypothetical protein MPSEU_001082000 [Mayamaea pseudoterrestris]|nr:hypothetical protein MPSEU_001082000 [Mayamaea pseudoterrestris]